MSSYRRALSDPRRPSQMWPEPNDDPNIPYAWGMNGYPLGDTLPLEADINRKSVPLSEILENIAKLEHYVRELRNFNANRTDGVSDTIQFDPALVRSLTNSALPDADFAKNYRHLLLALQEHELKLNSLTPDALSVLNKRPARTLRIPTSAFDTEFDFLVQTLSENVDILEKVEPTSELYKSAKLLSEILLYTDSMTKEEFDRIRLELNDLHVKAADRVKTLQEDNPKDPKYFPPREEIPTDPDALTPTTVPAKATERSTQGFWLIGLAALGLVGAIWYVQKDNLNRRR